MKPIRDRSTELQRLRPLTEALAQSGQWSEEAIRVNSQLLQIDPRDTSSRNRLARCYQAMGQVWRAAETWQEVLTVDPRNRIAQNRLEEMRAQGVLDAVSATPEQAIAQIVQQVETELKEQSEFREFEVAKRGSSRNSV